MMKLSILDDPEKAKMIDRVDMMGIVESFPDQCQEAVELAKTAELDALKGIETETSSILVLGMGGSGVSGDLVRTLLEGKLKVPVQVNKNYGIPRFAREDTLVFALSYSGNTEETLSGLDEAIKRGCKIICVTSGGEMAEKAEARGIPMVSIPSGIQPRAALGYLFFPILVTLQRLGFSTVEEKEIGETIRLLKAKSGNYGFNTPTEDNVAKALAARLYHMLPVVYGFSGLTDMVAFRWKCQFNENTKIPAIWNTFPELNHNETVSWELLETVSENFALILLRDRDESPQIKRRIEITRELIEEKFGGVEVLWAEGVSRLAKMLSLIYLGDFVSVYLALLYEIDPSPVERINILKKRLAE